MKNLTRSKFKAHLTDLKRLKQLEYDHVKTLVRPGNKNDETLISNMKKFLPGESKEKFIDSTCFATCFIAKSWSVRDHSQDIVDQYKLITSTTSMKDFLDLQEELRNRILFNLKPSERKLAVKLKSFYGKGFSADKVMEELGIDKDFKEEVEIYISGEIN
jgi:hypothetical protein